MLMTRFTLLPVAAALLVLAQLHAQDRGPNIVVLFADDAGYADFGFQPGCAEDMRELTPNIDSIAAAGVTMSSAYMSGSVCSPSRAGLMTGRYQTRFGHEYNIPPGYMAGGLPLSETFVAKRLRTLGYATALVGKWHLGYPAEYHPNERGFDWFYGCLQGSRSYFPYEKPSPHRVIQENGEATAEGGYTTDRLGDAGVRFLGDHKEEPFFLFVSFTAPHGPLQAKPEDLEKLAHIDKPRRRRYAGLVKALDDNVGKILRALDEQGFADNTLVVFTNDNGGQTQTGANNGRLRGRKGMLTEGGIRVPMCMRWPGKIEPGTTVEDPVISLDLLPTFVAAAGAASDQEWQLDGANLLPRLTGEIAKMAERPLYWRQGQKRALRLGRHKLLVEDVSADSAGAIYDLDADIAESRPLADADGELRKRLAALMAGFDAEMVPAKWGGRKRRRRGKNK